MLGYCTKPFYFIVLSVIHWFLWNLDGQGSLSISVYVSNTLFFFLSLSFRTISSIHFLLYLMLHIFVFSRQFHSQYDVYSVIST